MQSTITTTDTKSDALRSVRLGERSKDGLAIVDIVRRYAPTVEYRNLTGREIQSLYERDHGKRIETSTIAARVNDMVAARRLVRIAAPRACTVSGKSVLPVALAQSQPRLV